MRKSEIRQAIWEFLFERPRYKGEQIRKWLLKLAGLWAETLIWIAASANGTVGAVLILHILLVVGFIAMYHFFGKGR